MTNFRYCFASAALNTISSFFANTWSTWLHIQPVSPKTYAMSHIYTKSNWLSPPPESAQALRPPPRGVAGRPNWNGEIDDNLWISNLWNLWNLWKIISDSLRPSPNLVSKLTTKNHHIRWVRHAWKSSWTWPKILTTSTFVRDLPVAFWPD